MNLSRDVKITSALDYASAAADRQGAVLDMQGYEGVLAVVHFATITPGAVTTVKMQQDTDPLGATMADLEGTGIAVPDTASNEIFAIEVNRPTERYIRVVVEKDGANATGESAVYYQYGPGQRPVVNTVAGAVTVEFHASPSEGAA